MKTETKLWLRKKTLMALRALIWHADEWLHSEEVKLREDLSGMAPVRVVDSTLPQVGSTPAARSHRETFLQWEARRSGIAVISKKEARRRRTAAEFDLRFAR